MQVLTVFKVLMLALSCGNCQVDLGNMFNTSSSMPPGSFRQSRKSAIADSCNTNDGAPGTCMTRFNCMRQGGTSKGFCGTYGVCCETNLLCGHVSSLKRTIMKSPTQIVNQPCQYTIEPYSNNVCQLLIQFQRFELIQPDTVTHTCMDYFKLGNFEICGENSQQHLYFPFNAVSGNEPVTLTFSINSRWPQTNWHLVVTQLECPAVKRHSNALMPFITNNNLNDLRTIFSTHHSDWDLLAPPGCDQYYTQPMGHIKSFNYRDGINTFYMNNLGYVICIKSTLGANMIEYTVNRFSMSAEVPMKFFDEYCHPSVSTDQRSSDYLMIPQSVFLDNMYFQPTYFCGQGLAPRQVLLASAPFIMYFYSDDNVRDGETGFSINYKVKSTLLP